MRIYQSLTFKELRVKAAALPIIRLGISPGVIPCMKSIANGLTILLRSPFALSVSSKLRSGKVLALKEQNQRSKHRLP
jgi:hypothetical protein